MSGITPGQVALIAENDQLAIELATISRCILAEITTFRESNDRRSEIMVKLRENRLALLAGLAEESSVNEQVIGIIEPAKPAPAVELGWYEHYRGHCYFVVGVAKHVDTGEELVIYKPETVGQSPIHARPLADFNAKVEHNGKMVPRFRRI